MLDSVRDVGSRHALLLIVGLGAILRFATLDVQGFWLDEEATLNVIEGHGSGEGLVDVLRSVQFSESNPPLYYVLLAGWDKLFGAGETGIRSLSALAGTAAIPLVYLAANALGTRRAALIAAAIAATSPMLIWYSQEARNYELLVFLGALSFLCFVRALHEENGHRWLFSWGLASALALTTHYFAFALIVPEAAWLLWRRRGPRLDTLFATGTIAAVGIALLPLLATQRGRGGWIDAYDFGGRLLQVPEHFLTGLVVPWTPIPLIALAAVAVAVAYGTYRASDRAPIALAFGVAFAGLGVLLIAVITGDDYILSRQLLGLWPPFAVGVALALGSAATARVGTGVATALCAAGISLAVWTAATPDAQRPDYRPLAAELEHADEQRLIVSQTTFSSPLVRYVPGLRVASDEELAASELIVIEQRPLDDYAVGLCWWIATCGGVDTEPPPRFEPPPGFRPVGGGSTHEFSYEVYRAERPTAIERPLEYLTPRVFVQPPSG